MATTKWNRPRSQLITTGVQLARQGYNILSIAENLVRCHFRGRRYKDAERRLAGAIAKQFWMLHAGRTAAQQQIVDMATQLRAEGWKPLYADERDLNGKTLWLHYTGITVNANGGHFHSYAAATRATYHSALRTMLQQEA